MYSSKSMGSTALKRLMTEYKGPLTEDNFFVWEALIAGPDGTPYEGGIFPATLTFPRDYPLSPPTMKFTCEMFHPNGIFMHYLLILAWSWATSVRVCTDRLPLGGCYSLRRWHGLHLNPSSPRRRPKHVRDQLGAVESGAERGEDPAERCEHAGWWKIWRADRKEFDRIVRDNVRKTLGV
ncbi:ubiquitin-conjugating enzyme E2 G2-like protein [Endogone sp. FLAS-F59071]|nr:ubiquitin-conjugating enzyme E2 G2-like protein [Endogone sp. FLAS-F59071]|eukprot:RUS20639.1 ubiquitin-conjugating enzyme E2 G2-like protein [Endogone sp. FLAS-F59071]